MINIKHINDVTIQIHKDVTRFFSYTVMKFFKVVWSIGVVELWKGIEYRNKNRAGTIFCLLIIM